MEKLHPKAVWLFFFEYILRFIVLLAFLAGVSIPITVEILKAGKLPNFSLFLPWLVLIIFIYFIFCFVWAHLTYHFWRYQLTEDTLKIEKGVIWKKYISIPYQRIQNVDIYRGVIARILGLSDLQVQTAGYSGGYGRYGYGRTEGRLPGLGKEVAEELREELIKRVKGTKQGL